MALTPVKLLPLCRALQCHDQLVKLSLSGNRIGRSLMNSIYIYIYTSYIIHILLLLYYTYIFKILIIHEEKTKEMAA